MDITHIHYSENYNCATFVADWYKEKLLVDIPKDNVHDFSFFVWMRRNFEQTTELKTNTLVLMNRHGFNHVGVYDGEYVCHNYKPNKGLGAVVKTPISVIKRNYCKVTYWNWKW